MQNDTLALSFDAQLNLFIHRKNPENMEEILSTMGLNKHELFILLDSLLDIPEVAERAIVVLEGKELVRRNHGI